MAEDIERFLLQAAQRRRGRTLPETSARQPQDVEIVEAESVGPGGLESRVADRVAEDLDTSTFSERASRLGEQVGMADDDMEARLHHKFDRQIGRLGGDTTAADAPAGQQSAPPPAGGPAVSPSNLVQWLRSPGTLRQAVVLSEIFQRPEHRW